MVSKLNAYFSERFEIWGKRNGVRGGLTPIAHCRNVGELGRVSYID